MHRIVAILAAILILGVLVVIAAGVASTSWETLMWLAGKRD